MIDAAKNFARVTVSTGYDNVATTIVLNTGDGAKLPTAPFNVVWWNSTDYPDPLNDPNVEIVRVTAIATDTLTVTRAQESTSATTKNTAGKTYKMIAGLTALTMNKFSSVFVSGNSGSIPFINSSGDPAQDNANLFWDATNHRLGIGYSAPAAALAVNGVILVNTNSNGNGATAINAGGTIYGTQIVGTGSNAGGNVNGLLVQNQGNTNGTMATAVFQVSDANFSPITGVTLNDILTDRTAGATTHDFWIGTRNAGTFSEKFRITGAGNVGIGTSTPNDLVSIEGTSGNLLNLTNTGVSKFKITSGGVVTIPSSGSLAVGNIQLNSQTNTVGSASALILRSIGTQPIEFSIGGTEMARVDSSGNVGIGTTGPGYKLDVQGSNAIAFNAQTTGANSIFRLQNTSATGWSAADVYDNSSVQQAGFGYANPSSSNAALASNGYFWTRSGTNFVIDAGSLATPPIFVNGTSGNVGIGTTSPTNILSLGGQSARTIWMERETTAATAGNNLTLKAGGAVSGGTNLNGGNLILAPGAATGTGTANVQLQAVGGGSTGTTDSNPATIATVDSNGLLMAAGKNIRLQGGTSGTVTVATAAAAGTWTMTLPTSAGTNTYVLQTDGSGNTSWVAPGGGQTSRVRAYMTASQSISAATPTVVNFNATSFDNLSEFNTTTHVFTASAGGYYLINVHIDATPNSAVSTAQNYEIDIFKNGTTWMAYAIEMGNGSVSQGFTIPLTEFLQLSANDTISVKVNFAVAGTVNSGAATASYLEIIRLQ